MSETKIKFRSADAVINPHEEDLSVNGHSKDRLDTRVALLHGFSDEERRARTLAGRESPRLTRDLRVGLRIEVATGKF
jgi:hypothetical protein